jgi:hypothetical protein
MFSLNEPSREEYTMIQQLMIGCSVVLLSMLPLPAWALEYRLQVANLDFLTVSAYTDPHAGQPGEGSLRRLQERLDTMEFLASAIIPGREIQPLEDPRYGGEVPERLSILPTTRDQAWTTLVWDANPGETMAFVVKTDMVAWQQIWMLGANPEGMLRRLTIGGPSWFGRRSYEVSGVSYDFLANAADQGIFPSWMAQNAPSLHGMSLVIGQGRHRFYDPDRLYIVLKLPTEPHTYKVVVGWRDYSDRGTGSNERFSGL